MKGSRATQQKFMEKCLIVSTLLTWHNMAGKCSVPGNKLFSQPLSFFLSRVHSQFSRSTSPSERGLEIFSMLDHHSQEARDDEIELVDD